MAQSVLGKINYLTDAQYRKAKEEGSIDPNQIYLTPDDSDTEDDGNLEMGDVLKAVYPVGSIYMSINSTSPETLFGGTWEQLKDRFLLGAGDTYSNGTTGGSATHKLTVDEMPSHNHSMLANTNPGGQNAAIQHTWGTAYQGYDNNSCGYTGGGSAHNNMPPYLVVYMWKRTA